jgi:hypothetical protein
MNPKQMPDAILNDKCFTEMMDFVDELKRTKVLVFDSQVLPEPTALRFEGYKRVPVVGEILGGFFIVEVEDHAQAIDLAERCPHRQVGAIGLHALNETEQNAYQPDT